MSLKPRDSNAVPETLDAGLFGAMVTAEKGSILFEAGYVSTEEDARFLTSPEGRRAIATGMRRAIEAHFSRRFLESPEVTPQQAP